MTNPFKAGLALFAGLSLTTGVLMGQTILPLPFATNAFSITTEDALWQQITNNGYPTLYAGTTNDSKTFRGVFKTVSANTKLAIHSDDGSTATVDGQSTSVSDLGVDTHLTQRNSLKTLNLSFVPGKEYCVQISYSNSALTPGDQDGVSLYAYNGSGTVREGPIITSPRDAMCVPYVLQLSATCGVGPLTNWVSSNTNLATVSTNGAVTPIHSGSVTVTLTDGNNKSASVALFIVQPGITPASLTNCVGVTNTFILTNAAGTGLVTWSQSGTLSLDKRTNTLAFTNSGIFPLTAQYLGCIASANITAVELASLLPLTTNFCESGQVVYTNQTTPAGFSQLVNWGGEGLTGVGGSRTNTYSPGVHVVSNWCGTSVKYSTTTVYHIDIAQTGATVLANDSVSIPFNLTGGESAATWQVNPGGGPSLLGNSGNTVQLLAGPTAGNYNVIACSSALSSCCDTAAVQVVKVTFNTNLVGVCDSGTAPVSFTVQPTNFLGSLTFDTVTNLSTGPANTHATVSVTGTNLTLTGVIAGTAYLRARLGASFYVGPTIKITRITFPTNAWSVGVGYNTPFAVTNISPIDAPVIYQSANPSIATVTGSGTNVVITGVSTGTVQLRAFTGSSVPCATKNVDVASVTMTPNPIELCVSQSGTITMTIVPPGAVVDVSSEDPSIASVGRNGNTLTVTALVPGSTSVRAKVNGFDVGISDIHCARVTFPTNDLYVAVSNVNYLPADVEPGYFASRINFLMANPSVATVTGGPDVLTIMGLTNLSTQIEAWFGTNQMCASKTVNVVQPAIASVEWLNLDRTAITNLNPSAGGGLRTFADRPTGAAPPENRVRLRARITPSVPFANRIYFQVYDVDDPSANTAPLDNEATATDNRGTWTQLPMTPISADSNGVAETVFTVSPNPGDNFRAVAAVHQSFFNGIAARQNDGINASLTNTISTNVPASNVSSLLTIWRRLHVEVDSMSTVTNNIVTGNITGISGGGATATNLNLSVNLRTGLTPQDASSNLSSGNERGRFENGWMRIGASALQTGGIYGNGDTFVRNPGGFTIPAEIVSGGTQVSAGQVIAMAGSLFTVSGNLGAVSYAGGAFRAAGTTFTITANSTNTITVSGSPQIPFTLHDDDDDNLLSHLIWPLVGLYSEAFITLVPSAPSSTDTNVPFVLNLGENTSVLTANFDEMNAGADDYWVVCLLGSYQYLPYQTFSGGSLGDQDPNSEPGVGGLATGADVTGGGGGFGAFVYLETIRDRLALGADPGLEQRVTTHELGHALGLPHNTQGGIMWPSVQSALPNGLPFSFLPSELHQLRNRTKSPGR